MAQCAPPPLRTKVRQWETHMAAFTEEGLRKRRKERPQEPRLLLGGDLLRRILDDGEMMERVHGRIDAEKALKKIIKADSMRPIRTAIANEAINGTAAIEDNDMVPLEDGGFMYMRGKRKEGKTYDA